MQSLLVPDRRLFVGGAAGALALAPFRAAAGSAYSESVMMMLFAPDGSADAAVRMERLIGKQQATIWANYLSDHKNFAMADVMPLGPADAPTPVDRADVAFEQHGAWRSRFERSRAATGNIRCAVNASLGLAATRDPEEGEGALPAVLSMSFTGLHPPVLVRGGRMETFGRGSAEIQVDGRRLKVSGFAKWHEQVGERPRFAPAFTYLAISGGSYALLAIRSGENSLGFALKDGATIPVAEFEIAPLAPSRRFSARLADGHTIKGETRTLRVFSEPVEGKRRPGATVRAQTDLGPMVGQLNDWVPPP